MYPRKSADKATLRRVWLAGEFKTWLRNVTVEPLVCLYIVGSVVANLATQNLNLEKACRVNIKYNDTICSALARRETAGYSIEEETVQKMVASFSVWKTLVQSSIPAVLILFSGGWSDRHCKRKPFMLIPIVGELLTSLGLIINTYYFYELPVEAALITESIFPAISGGWMTMFMAIFSFVADNSDLKSRTVRIGILHMCTHISIPLGMTLSGILYKKIGFYGVFSLSFTLYVLAFTYGCFCIKETHSFELNEKKTLSLKEASCCNLVKDFFELQHLKETISVSLKKGAGKRRARVVWMMLVVVLITGTLHGEMTVIYLFARFRFNWDEVDFSIFSTYSMITNLVGTLLSVVVFSHILKVDDAIIGVMSCTSKILSSFVYAFATTTWMIYLAPLVEIMNGTSFIAMRSIVSKLVPTDELGKINSMIGLAESIVPVIYGPMYSAVYAATMETMPGTFYLLGGALTFPAVLIFLWMYGQHKGDKKRQKHAEEAEKTQIDNISSKLTGIDNAAFVPV